MKEVVTGKSETCRASEWQSHPVHSLGFDEHGQAASLNLRSHSGTKRANPQSKSLRLRDCREVYFLSSRPAVRLVCMPVTRAGAETLARVHHINAKGRSTGTEELSHGDACFRRTL